MEVARVNQRRGLGKILIALVVATRVGVIATVPFFYVLRRNETQLQQALLWDFCQQNGAYVESRLTGYVSTLQSVADCLHLGAVDVGNEAYVSLFRSLIVHDDFHAVAVVGTDGTGVAVTADSRMKVDLSQNEYWERLRAGETVVSAADFSLTDSARVFVVAAPILDADAGFMGAVGASIPLDDFQSYEARRQGADVYLSFVIDHTGSIVLRPQESALAWTGDNLLDILKAADDSVYVGALAYKLKQGGTFTLNTIFENGEKSFAYFMPLNLYDWYVVSIAPQSVVQARLDRVVGRNVAWLVTVQLLAVIGLCAVIVHYVRRATRMEKSREERLRQRLLSNVVGFIEADLFEDRALHVSDRLHTIASTEGSLTKQMQDYIERRVPAEYRTQLCRLCSPEELADRYHAGNMQMIAEFPKHERDGSTSWYECDVSLEEDVSKHHLTACFVIRNIARRTRREPMLRERAEHDPLTGLMNRAADTGRIDTYLAINPPSEGAVHALCMIDFDNFKTLNDTLGHGMGDRALCDAAEAVRQSCPSDAVLCRMGGDEFIVFLKNVPVDELGMRLGEMQASLRFSYEQDGQRVEMSASVGVARAPTDGISFQALYRCADKAMYHVKHNGKNSYMLYVPEMEDQ